MGVLEVEVVVTGLDLLDGDFPGCFVFLPLVPPVDTWLQMLEADGFGHGVGFLPLGDAVLVEPDFLGWGSFLEKKQICADGGIGLEDAVRQADNGVEVALLQQVFLEPRLDAFAEEGAVRQDHCGAAAGFEKAHDEGKEEIRRLACLEVFGKVGLDAVFLSPAEGRIGEDDIHPVRLGVADIGAGQGVVMADEGWVVDAVEKHIRDAEHVRELLFLSGAQALLHLLFVLRGLHVAFAHVADGAGQEPARTAGGIEEDLPRFRVDTVGHEGRYGAGGVVLTRVAGALKVVEDLLVDIAEVLSLGQVVEVDGGNLIDHLAHELARLHVIVGVLEDTTHHAAAAVLSGAGQLLELGEKLIIDKGHERVAGQSFGIGGPGSPLELSRDGRTVAVLHHLQFSVLVIDDLEEEHPTELGDALGVAIDADILAHNVLNGFDGGSHIHKESGCLFVDCGLEFVDGLFKAGTSAKLFQ